GWLSRVSAGISPTARGPVASRSRISRREPSATASKTGLPLGLPSALIDIIQSSAYISVKATNGGGSGMSAETMTGERIEVELAAPPARVYEAIATAGGVRSWWTDGTFAEEVGGIGRLSFGHGWTELRV